MNVASLRLEPPRALMNGLRTAAIFGGSLFLLGLFVNPARAWGGYLMGFTFFVCLGLAGGLFLTILTLANGRWATALRRIPEALTTTLPVAALMGVVLLGGVHSLYEWSHPSVVAGDPILEAKSVYLNWGFFLVRMLAYFALWIWLTRGMVACSRLQDSNPDPNPDPDPNPNPNSDSNRAHSRRRRTWALRFLPIFALTFSLASVDWLASLEPHFFSTIYALVTLSGLATSGLAVCILFAVHLRRGPLRGVISKDHLDDLGKIGIALALFWGYIWYCQYMLIWYTNMPEETPYYALRMQGDWKALGAVNLALNWAIPFFALMPKIARRTPAILARVAWVMLAGQALNLYMLVEPSLLGEQPQVGAWEIGPVVGALCLFAWLVLRGLAQAPLVPYRDPALAESLEHHS